MILRTACLLYKIIKLIHSNSKNCLFKLVWSWCVVMGGLTEACCFVGWFLSEQTVVWFGLVWFGCLTFGFRVLWMNPKPQTGCVGSPKLTQRTPLTGTTDYHTW